MDLANTLGQEGESKGGIQVLVFTSPYYRCPKVGRALSSSNRWAICPFGENNEGN